MDASFAAEAASGGMAEVKRGQFAQEKSSSDVVKAFGNRMETDHSKADDQLKGIAARNNIALPSDLNQKDQAAYDRLSGLSGAEFDRAYARDMVTDHEKDIAAFKKESNSGTNEDIKNFASTTLTTLEEHLKLAREMEKSVGAKASTSASQ
ncbi:MAG TPA: DUF4142 domain-containing protein [Candidatus Acidoferrales bacterium]|nr:DUF4142 domain-containing protein [Candidatus Acidoferrales bacterium]